MGAPVDRTTVISASKSAFPVWSTNVESVDAFLTVHTQWNFQIGPVGAVWVGLKYEAVLPTLALMGIGKGVFADLQVMEAAALEILNERSDR